jgi:serine/threonine protein kinase/Tol biopolymer transport system component
MPLSVGARLGSFEIITALGAGGMGEVWKARDTTLGRDVALKILPDHLALDPDRLARFKREAQILASLNHPNIATIHGFQEADPSPGSGQAAVQALVLELVEGPTLADRIAQGPIPIDEALPIAKQIAEGLEAAHEQGIIHRDLKPANIKLRPDGTVKVLDFGLAKALSKETSATDLSISPTITSPALMTAGGVILGTAAYMSPEQVRGKPVDKRTDIWAFGCVIYEMLTGRRTVTEATVSDTLAGVLKGEPDWSALPDDTPAKIRGLIERCLRKDVRRRLPDIAEARIEIEEVRSEPDAAALSTTPVQHRSYVWPAIAALSLLAAAGLASRIAVTPAPDTAIVRFDIVPPEGATPFTTFGTNIDIGQPLSPDGRNVAFLATSEDRRVIWVRSLDASTARPLRGTEEAERPVWSPDSQFIAFFAQGQLKKVAIVGGPPAVISNQAGRDVAWSPENVMLIGGQGKPLLRVSAAGGEATPATALGANETTHDYPEFLPDGRHFLYMARHGGDPTDWDVFVGRLDSEERHLLPGIHAGVRYSPTGHLLFIRDQTLMAHPFDLTRLELTGEAFPVEAQQTPGPRQSFSISTNGSLAYLSGLSNPDSQLAWFDRAGKPLGPLSPRGGYSRVFLSPDDRHVAFEPARDIFLFDMERSVTSRFVSTAAADFAPLWSPDGRTIAFASSRDPSGNNSPTSLLAGNLYGRAVGTVGEDTLLLKTDVGKTPSDWSRDGRYLAYDSGNDVWALPLTESGAATPLRVTDTRFVEINARFSPDGRWIAYQSNESGIRFEVYIQSFPNLGGKQQVSASGGSQPRWGRDGRELFYIAPDLTLMSVSLKPAGTDLRASTPVPLFQVRVSQGNPDYEVSRDGRFLLNIPASEQTARLTVIHNWMAGLKQ